MRRATVLLIACSIAAMLTVVAPASRAARSSRVIVSTTLNDTLQVFDAASLAPTQPPLPSKGAGPVRMDVYAINGRPYLFTANHGVNGSLGVFDLSGDLVTELALSPFPTRPGSVGVSAGEMLVWGPDGAMGWAPMAMVTNTWNALGGCAMPSGSATAFDLTHLPVAGVALDAGTVDLPGALPYGVHLDGVSAYASTYCSDKVSLVVARAPSLPAGALQIAKVREVRTSAGPDGLEHHGDVSFVANIAGNSISIMGPSPNGFVVGSTIPLPGAGPVELATADADGGRRFLLSANGADDTVGVIDPEIARACFDARAQSCPEAVLARIPTGLAGGAPEGIAYDPRSGRIFVVNKKVGDPSLTVIALDQEDPRRSAAIATIPLLGAGEGTLVPALTAYDVVVQTR